MTQAAVRAAIEEPTVDPKRLNPSLSSLAEDLLDMGRLDVCDTAWIIACVLSMSIWKWESGVRS